MSEPAELPRLVPTADPKDRVKVQSTAFTHDLVGRYVCNTMSEATGSGPFDTIVMGGGTFGATVAHYLFLNDAARARRVLVLEGGPMLVGEHVQNLPLPGIPSPGPRDATSIAQLRLENKYDRARFEVWGLAWHSSTPFIGLAYCIGGRSLYWGGWSPEPLDSELSTAGPSPWPKPVVDDLKRYYPGTSRQLGVDETNDFINGDLQNALRRTLYDGVTSGKVRHAIPLPALPTSPVVRGRPAATDAELRQLLGDPDLPAQIPPRDIIKLEAPLAVQTGARSGFFPSNKFSPVPLLMRATRLAAEQSLPDDRRKRLMVVPNCHVTRLRTVNGRVEAVETNQGDVPVPPNGRVIVALGTIESTRLALNSFQGLPGIGDIGANLIAHLRSNLTIRVLRAHLPNLAATGAELQAAALFLKGAYRGKDGQGLPQHFHLQISASGLGSGGGSAEAELFQKIPDIDTLDRFFGNVSDTHVVITIRGIGEMSANNPKSFVTQDPEVDTLFGDRRAFVQLQEDSKDSALWSAMDQAADDVALLFAGGESYEVLTTDGFAKVQAGQPASTVAKVSRHDGLGTTHHEAGTLRMGVDPDNSATDVDARFHGIANAYAVGPALQPTIGSPNPMLTGVALARRLADHLVPVPPTSPADGPLSLFNGSDLNDWRMAGVGSCLIADQELIAAPGGDLGLLWCTIPTPADFVLRCEWRRTAEGDNSGVFVRFPDPNSKGYDNTAYVAVHFGFEVQIDETAAVDEQLTGAIYGEPQQQFDRVLPRPPGINEWNSYEIRVQGDVYTIKLNGQQTTRFVNEHPGRGVPSMPNAPSFIGLQSHTGAVAYRNMTVEAI